MPGLVVRKCASLGEWCRQSEPLSHVLFDAVIYLALRYMDINIWIPVRGQTLSFQAFVDDVVILAKAPGGSSNSIHKCCTGCAIFFPINAPGMGRFKLFNLVGHD